MALASGTRLGPYAITAQIGVGGMGVNSMNRLHRLAVFLMTAMTIASIASAQATGDDSGAILDDEGQQAADDVAPVPEVARSFEQLQALVESGDRIRVISGPGQSVQGRIVALSSSLVLLANDAQLDLQEDDVWFIEERRGDSLVNGALLGLGAGLLSVLTVGYIIECSRTQCGGSSNNGDYDYGELGVILGLGAIGGAGIGIAVDAMVRRWQLVYERPARPAATATLSPIVATARGCSSGDSWSERRGRIAEGKVGGVFAHYGRRCRRRHGWTVQPPPNLTLELSTAPISCFAKKPPVCSTPTIT